MAHMQREVTGNQAWIIVETSQGTEIVPWELIGFIRDSDPQTHPLTKAKREEYKKALWDYTDGEPEAWETVRGFGARFSAPGYMDCTEWSVFDTLEEANEYLDSEDDTEEEDTEEEDTEEED